MKLKIFKGANGQYYWHLRAKNGQIIAIGGEGYSRKFSALRGFRRLWAAQVVEVAK